VPKILNDMLQGSPTLLSGGAVETGFSAMGIALVDGTKHSISSILNKNTTITYKNAIETPILTIQRLRNDASLIP
jgi:hypothetical protein